jgi:hypothetical protein
MVELFILGPMIVGGAVIAFYGKRLLARAGLQSRPALVIAVLAAVAAAGAWLVFLLDGLFYALGENGPTYYDFSPYQRYRDVTASGWFFPISLGYALLAAGLALAAAVVWRRVHPSAGLVIAAAACVAVVLPGVVPQHLDRVEYGVDPVLHLAKGDVRSGPDAGRFTPCFQYSVEGQYLPNGEPADPTPPPTLCVHVSGDPSFIRDLERELNAAGIEPHELPSGVEVDGLEVGRASWTVQ